jgi:N-acetylglutamate synthase-like GNAT family acetyltransferase
MKETDISLRRAGRADADAIAALVDAAYAKYVPRIGREPYPMTVDYAASVAEHQVWVAEVREQIIGTLVLVPSGDHLLIENVAVSPDHQGAGLGKRFLQLADREAARQEFAEVRLYTNVRFTENIAFYSRYGYAETGRGDLNGLNVVFMSKAPV